MKFKKGNPIHRPSRINKYEIKKDVTILFARKNGRNCEVKIDTEDLPRLTLFNHTWRVNDRNSVFVQVRKDGKTKSFVLSRFILNCEGKSVVDHINFDRLDNRKDNLRVCSRSQNNTHRSKTKALSGKIGVNWNKTINKWQSCIKVNKKFINLGCFKDKEVAIKVRKEAEKKFLGEFAPTC